MARGGRYTVKTVSAKNGQVGPTSENVQRRRAYSRMGARRSGYGENHGAAANTTESAKPGRKSLPRQRNGLFLCRDNSVGLLHKLTGRAPRGG